MKKAIMNRLIASRKGRRIALMLSILLFVAFAGKSYFATHPFRLALDDADPSEVGESPLAGPAESTAGSAATIVAPIKEPEHVDAEFLPGPLDVRRAGGRNTSAFRKDAAIAVVSVFIDGLPSSHDPELIAASEPIVERLQDLLNEDDPRPAILEAQRLMHHANPMVRWSVMEAYWWLGAPALTAMAPMMDDVDDEIRMWAIETFFEELAMLRNPHLALSALAIAVQNPDAAIRLQVLEELAELPPALSFPAIANLLEDVEEEIRHGSQLILSFYASQDFASTSSAMEWFAQNMDALAEFDDDEYDAPIIMERRPNPRRPDGAPP
jgi:hypothetical protein